MLKKIELKDAVGTKLAHDMTEIRPGEFKGAAFHKGHMVCNEDLCRLQKMGKNHLYVIDLDEDEIHEDQAAAILADALAGDGIVWKDEPREGKIKLLAEKDGLFAVNTAALAAFNMVDEVMCATLHNHTLVKKGELVAATRAIPLIMKRAPIQRAAAIARQNGAVLAIRPIRKAKVGLVITGSEVYHGRIEDKFGPVVQAKLIELGSTILRQVLVSDDVAMTVGAIRDLIRDGADMVAVTGGMSVDPDDQTPASIRAAGARVITYGAPVLPGAMFMLAYIGQVPVLGLPGCVMYYRASIFDLVVPRILAGETVTRADITAMGHGGLCAACEDCRFPQCAFGK